MIVSLWSQAGRGQRKTKGHGDFLHAVGTTAPPVREEFFFLRVLDTCPATVAIPVLLPQYCLVSREREKGRRSRDFPNPFQSLGIPFLLLRLGRRGFSYSSFCLHWYVLHWYALLGFELLLSRNQVILEGAVNKW